MESVFSDRDLQAKNKGGGRAFWFKAPTKNIEILTCSSVEGVSLANNHTEDFGEEGYLDTVKTVKNAGLEYGIEDKIIYYDVIFLYIKLPLQRQFLYLKKLYINI